MGARERWTRLLGVLGERGTVEVGEAAELLGVSTATVRRDLDELARQQLVTRTRGGAVLGSVTYDLPLRYRTGRRADEKHRIAEATAQLVPPGAVVALNGGTTTSEVARELAVRADLAEHPSGTGLTVVTNAVNIASELAVRPHVKTVVTGGVVRESSFEVTGPLAPIVLGEISMDFAILGVNAVDPVHGASAFDEDEARVNRVLAERADKVIVVADSTKVGQQAFAQICAVEDIWALITDTDLSDELADGFAAEGVDVICV
ncbi:DeoR/GlpR family DNA-binding transcription regulator [Kitasatospora terrestris]|uniref:DeoR/GlpR family DNA-binding transcription regulator n=1 Tax=Kitasatospora terrestris TaxID=258051 RepID=A0ABP9ER01_9ACTN